MEKKKNNSNKNQNNGIHFDVSSECDNRKLHAHDNNDKKKNHMQEYVGSRKRKKRKTFGSLVSIHHMKENKFTLNLVPIVRICACIHVCVCVIHSIFFSIKIISEQHCIQYRSVQIYSLHSFQIQFHFSSNSVHNIQRIYSQ